LFCTSVQSYISTIYRKVTADLSSPPSGSTWVPPPCRVEMLKRVSHWLALGSTMWIASSAVNKGWSATSKHNHYQDKVASFVVRIPNLTQSPLRASQRTFAGIQDSRPGLVERGRMLHAGSSPSFIARSVRRCNQQLLKAGGDSSYRAPPPSSAPPGQPSTFSGFLKGAQCAHVR